MSSSQSRDITSDWTSRSKYEPIKDRTTPDGVVHHGSLVMIWLVAFTDFCVRWRSETDRAMTHVGLCAVPDGFSN